MSIKCPQFITTMQQFFFTIYKLCAMEHDIYSVINPCISITLEVKLKGLVIFNIVINISFYSEK